MLSMLISGCASPGYYGHLLAGQFRIWRDREPIERLLEAGTLPTTTAHRLRYAVRARAFAFDALALPDNGSFRDYVDLQRDFVIWNVFAAPELSLEPFQSCYPFAGCFSYRGFFTQERARHYAAAMKRKGFDVYVGGVAAYSTLGWLDDPILSSMLNRDEARVAEIIFHELAHERLYVPDDTSFNESFAMSVATTGLARWLPVQGGDFKVFESAQRRHEEFIQLMLSAREALTQHFTSTATDVQKRLSKEAVYRQLREDYANLKASWSGEESYDVWMETELNNAKLASISTYHDHVGAFMSILARCDHDLRAFYQSVERLAGLPPTDRNSTLR